MGRRGSRGWGQSCGTEGGLALSAIRESRVRRFHAGFLTTLIVCLVVLLGCHLLLSAQTLHYAKRPDVRMGRRSTRVVALRVTAARGRVLPQRAQCS
jgi:hypothetical protein